jgi:hypothetical protein
MSVNRKATMAKRQRELDQKDRAREREQRRMDRRTARNGAPAGGGGGGGNNGSVTTPSTPSGPVLGVDGPRSLAELLAAQQAAAEKPEE